MKKLLLTFLLLITFVAGSYATLDVRQAVFPTMCRGGAYVTQTVDLILTDHVTSDFVAQTCVGTCPNFMIDIGTGGQWEYEPGVGQVTYNSGGDFTFVTMYIGTSYILVNFATSGTTHKDTIRISGLRVRATTIAIATQPINRTGGNADVTGMNLADVRLLFTLNSTGNPAPAFTLAPSFCDNINNNYALNGSPTGGTYSVSPGVTGANFNPFGLAAGSTSITYTVVNGGGCSNSTTASTTIVHAPTVSFSSSDGDNVICEGDLVTFTANTSSTANRYLFLKNGNGIQGPNSSNTYTISSLNDGDGIAVTVDNGSGTCQTTSSSIVTTVGKIPKPNFSWMNTCGTNNVQYADLSLVTQIGSSIVGWSWDVDNNGSVDYTAQNPSHSFSAPNSYFTKLQVTTNRGCVHDTIIKVFTLTGVTVTATNPYFTTFTSTNATWAFEGKNASWKWGAAAIPTINTGARNIWSTSASSSSQYYADEKSYLNSPCFDFTQLDKPMISLKIWMETNINAGAILEASADGGTTWKQVGRTGIGTNWYDGTGNAGVDDFPEAASVSDAWEGNYNNWKVAKLALNEYAGKPSVRFRIAFGSSIVTAITGGMAFDSVWVGNRSKLTLLEHFTNLNSACFNCSTADIKVSGLAKKRNKDLIPLFFHTNSPFPDVYNSYNPADVNTRYGTRGSLNIPFSIYETQARVADYKGIGTNYNIDTNDVDSRALETPLYKVDLTTNMNVNGKVDVNTRITYIGNNPYNGDIVFHLVFIEDTTDGNTNYNWTVRKMLPGDGAGLPLSRTWNNGDSFSSSDSWVHSLTGIRKFAVVAFVETGGPNPSILQVAYQKGTGTSGSFVPTSVGAEFLTEANVLIFPNPSSDEFNIAFNEITNKNCTWELLNTIGTIVDVGVIEKNTTNTTIKTQTYSDGVYLLKFMDSQNHLIIKKIIIQH